MNRVGFRKWKSQVSYSRAVGGERWRRVFISNYTAADDDDDNNNNHIDTIEKTLTL